MSQRLCADQRADFRILVQPDFVDRIDSRNVRCSVVFGYISHLPIERWGATNTREATSLVLLLEIVTYQRRDEENMENGDIYCLTCQINLLSLTNLVKSKLRKLLKKSLSTQFLSM